MQPHPTHTQTARNIIQNPDTFGCDPILRAAAWAAAKQARGHTVDLDSMAFILLDTHRASITAETITQTRQKIETALDDTTTHSPILMARVTQKVRGLKAKLGLTRRPYGGDAA